MYYIRAVSWLTYLMMSYFGPICSICNWGKPWTDQKTKTKHFLLDRVLFSLKKKKRSKISDVWYFQTSYKVIYTKYSKHWPYTYLYFEPSDHALEKQICRPTLDSIVSLRFDFQVGIVTRIELSPLIKKEIPHLLPKSLTEPPMSTKF